VNDFTSPDDLPYGPGQSDYEYDDDRQRELDDSAEAEAHHEQLITEQLLQEKPQ
jgi:hypothetical protein